MFDLSTLKKLFSFAILSKLLPTVGSLAFGLYIAYMGWISLGPEKPEPDKYRKELATAAVNKAVEEIRNSRGDIRTAVMVHFANDPSDFVSDTMRKRLNSSGVLSLEDISFSERLEKILNLRTAGAENEKEALAAAKHHKVQGVLWGKIDTFESSDRGAILTGEWTLTDKEGNTVCSGKFDANMEVKHVQGNKVMRLSQPQQIMASERKILDEAYAGDSVGLLLRYIHKSDIERGDFLLAD